MKIFIASDHNGFKLKNSMKEHLLNEGFDVEDLGPYEFDPSDDYPDYAVPAAKKVGETAGSAGILICKNGVGVSVAANKLAGIRAALTWNPEHAESSREDDDSNVLALPSGYIDERTALEIADAWLNTEFSGAERHIRRLKKVMELKS